MPRKDRIDAFGVTGLLMFALLMGFNQVVIKVVNDGLQPVFAAGLRSAGAILCVALWMWLRGVRFRIAPRTFWPGIWLGLFFAVEFMLVFVALDLTSVAVVRGDLRLAGRSGFGICFAGERIGAKKAVGLALAIAGRACIPPHARGTAPASLVGDLCALAGAMCWAAIALVARAARFSQRRRRHLLAQVVVSSLVLLPLAPLFGPLVREFEPIHAWGLGFLTVVVASGGFLFWFWLLKVYPASGVASFSFLSPVFGVVFGWLILGERIGPSILGALALVAVGIVLINRPARRPPG
ncbi:MAG: DMT family transporter [Paracoccaceae bacterium]